MGTSRQWSALAWNGAEKFYAAEEWMHYLIDHFLRPGARAQTSGDSQFAGFAFDHRCDGRVLASGEEFPDLWRIEVASNDVQTAQARIGLGFSRTWPLSYPRSNEPTSSVFSPAFREGQS
jgi:hypothetical protein